MVSGLAFYFHDYFEQKPHNLSILGLFFPSTKSKKVGALFGIYTIVTRKSDTLIYLSVYEQNFTYKVGVIDGRYF